MYTVVDSSSSESGYEATNIASSDNSTVWLSKSTVFPHFIMIKLKSDRRKVLTTCGFYNWQQSNNNPRIIELHVSSNGIEFMKWNVYEFHKPSDELQLCSLNPIPNEVQFIKIIITATYNVHGKKTYLNRFILYNDTINQLKLKYTADELLCINNDDNDNDNDEDDNYSIDTISNASDDSTLPISSIHSISDTTTYNNNSSDSLFSSRRSSIRSFATTQSTINKRSFSESTMMDGVVDRLNDLEAEVSELRIQMKRLTHDNNSSYNDNNSSSFSRLLSSMSCNDSINNTTQETKQCIDYMPPRTPISSINNNNNHKRTPNTAPVTRTRDKDNIRILLMKKQQEREEKERLLASYMSQRKSLIQFK